MSFVARFRQPRRPLPAGRPATWPSSHPPDGDAARLACDQGRVVGGRGGRVGGRVDALGSRRVQTRVGLEIAC